MRKLVSSWWLQVYIVDFGLACSLPDTAKAQTVQASIVRPSWCHSHLFAWRDSLLLLTTHQISECMSCLLVDAV